MVYPRRRKARLSFRVDLWVHFSPEIGSPAVASRAVPPAPRGVRDFFFEAEASATGSADAAGLQGLGVCQFPQASANGRAAQPGNRGQSRDAATTALQCKDGGDPPARHFVGQGEELVQGGVVLGDIPLGVFAALEAVQTCGVRPSPFGVMTGLPV